MRTQHVLNIFIVTLATSIYTIQISTYGEKDPQFLYSVAKEEQGRIMVIHEAMPTKKESRANGKYVPKKNTHKGSRNTKPIGEATGILIVPTSGGRYKIYGPNGISMAKPDNGGGFRVTGPHELIELIPRSGGSYMLITTKGTSYVTPTRGGGYRVRGAEGEFYAAPVSGGRYRVKRISPKN